MAIMTAQLPLMLVPAGAVQIGEIAALVEDETGGRVFIRGELVFAWNAGDELGRRLAAVQLVAIKGARAVRVAEGFGINTETLRRWDHAAANDGIAALVPGRGGPTGPSRLSPAVVADTRARRRGGASLRAIATAVGVSEAPVRRALPAAKPEPEQDETTSTDINDDDTCGDDADDDQGTSGADQGAEDDLPLLPPPADRGAERAAARWGKLPHADPVFAPAARVPLAGLLLAIPALQTTGLLSCATQVFGCLRNGFCGLDTMLLEAVLRALAGQPRVEGATRVDPAALGRVLGLDRGPEVKTSRAKITTLAATGRAGELLAAMAAAHVARLDASDPDLLAVFYVDGHVRAYQGGAKIAKTHLSRLKFPAPATVETWVSDASGDPVLVVMAHPGASLAMELRRLLPDLRRAVGDDGRGLVGFDRGRRVPALFLHLGGPTRRRDRSSVHDAAGEPTGRGQQDQSGPGRPGQHPADPHPDHPDRPTSRAGHLPDGFAVAAGELLPLRPDALRPRLPRRAGHHRRRPCPYGPQPGQEESPPTGPGRQGPLRPSTGRDRRGPAGSGVPTAG